MLAGCRKHLEGGRAPCPHTHRSPAPGKSLGDVVRGALHAVPGWENPCGAGNDRVPMLGMWCPCWGCGAHGGDGVPMVGVLMVGTVPMVGTACPWQSLSPCSIPGDGSEPTWGQRPWGASWWLRRCWFVGRRAALALRGRAGAAQGRGGGRWGAAIGCLRQRCWALQGEAELRGREGTGTSGTLRTAATHIKPGSCHRQVHALAQPSCLLLGIRPLVHLQLVALQPQPFALQCLRGAGL